MRVHVHPRATGDDQGEGGVGRIVRMQQDWLASPQAAQEGWELADGPEDADVLACHITIPEQWVRDYPDKPVVAHVHGLYWSDYEWNQAHLNINREVSELIRIADVVTSPSEWVSRVIRQQYWRHPRTIYHAVNQEEWAAVPLDDNPPRYVFFDKTRTDPVCETYSMREVALRLPDIQFITTAPVEEPIPDNIQFINRVPWAKAARLLKNATAYLATTRETFGVSNVQALVSGVPIVGYRWGGQREIEQIVPEADIRLVKPFDYEALAAEIRDVFELAAPRVPQEWPHDLAHVMDQYTDSWLDAYQHRQAMRTASYDVSVIVTAYNLVEYLPGCLDSVLVAINEARKAGIYAECVVVDDASPDDCGVIADKYAYHNLDFVVVHNAENQYLAGARNTGVANSVGRYILPLDADDMLPPDAIVTLYKALESQRYVDIAYGMVEWIEVAQDNRRWHSTWPIEWSAEMQLSGRNCLPYSSMFRRRVFDTIGGYRTRCQTAEDADFWMRAAMAGFRGRKVTQADTLIYHNRPGSMSKVNEAPDHSVWVPQQLPGGVAAVATIPVPSLDPPVIAVVIPVGPGHEKYLFDALDSVYAQDFLHWECIVVDDTTDGLDVAMLPPWVRYVATRGMGTAAARNAGISEAKARLFLPLDADDMLQPSALSVMYDAYVDSGRKSVIYSDFWEDPDKENEFRVYQCPDFECSIVMNKGPHAVTALTLKDYWQAVGGYDENLYGWEDWGFQLKLAANGIPSRRVARPLFTYHKWRGYRREENVGEFERSRKSFQARFNGYEGTHWRILADGQRWERIEKVACVTCGARATQTFLPEQQAQQAARSSEAAQDGAVLIAYKGQGQGSHVIRGKATGTRYLYDFGVSLWVLRPDAPYILLLPDYEEVEPEAAQDTEPKLTARGKRR